jgi:S-adenosylmethionine-diacylglycerol 3-amino-3-carboxypropyl transferase
MSNVPKMERPAWVDEAAGFPIAFAQVREDPEIDRRVVEQLAGDPFPRKPSTGDVDVVMIASGGCTAAYLASLPSVRRLHLVDAGAAQLGLTRLKLRLLANSPDERKALLGHTPMDAEVRRTRLAELGQELELSDRLFGEPAAVARLGPDHAGRYELVFAALQADLSDVRNELAELLGLDDTAAQTAAAAPSTALGRRLDEAVDRVMSLPNLVALFGRDATNNAAEPFSRHFARRIRHALATLPAADNPFLWQMLTGRYSPREAAPWLEVATPARLPRLTFECRFMADALRESAPESFDMVHLSNIVDWLSVDDARETLEAAWRVLRPGGRVLIRQLNSSLDIRALGSSFQWLREESDALHATDRSFFYRALHLGRKI